MKFRNLLTVLLLFSMLATATHAASPTLFEPASRTASLEKAARKYQKRFDSATPDRVLNWLKAGNARFAAGKSTHGGFPIDTRQRIQVSALGQMPLTAVLTCMDSRTTPDLVFDTSVGDIFTTRIAANVINEDIIGSLEFAVSSGIKVLVVLGHTRCGGVRAACAGVQFEHITQLLERVRPAIDATNAFLDGNSELNREVGAREPSNAKYIAKVSHTNATQSANQLLERSSYLREQVRTGQLKLMPAMYNVDTGVVTFDEAREVKP